MKHLFSQMASNVLKIFSGKNLIWHALAIFLTYLIVVTKFDWEYFLSARSEALNTFLFPAVIIGGLLPIILPACVLAIGILRKNYELRVTAWALIQATILGSFISSLYKAFTGRIQPNLMNLTADISTQFNFGFWQHGIFWGWPSSHTTIAFAMAFTLINLFPKKKLLVFCSVVYAFYIGFGVSISIHWFSDFAAGAIIGTVIGAVVGESFALLLTKKSTT